MTMDAILATIVNGGQAILLITQRSIEKNISPLYLELLQYFFLSPPQPTPWIGCPRIGLCGFVKSTPLEGQMAPPPWLGFYCPFVGCGGWSRDVMSSSYVKKWYKITLRWEVSKNVTFCPTLACTTPDGFICPSTAYEGYQTPCVYLTWMWEPFQVGLEPQPMHCGVICQPAVTQGFSCIPKSGFKSVVVTAWWWIHQPIQSIWRLHLAYVWHVCGNHSRWVWSLNHCIVVWFVDQLWPRKTKSWPTSVLVMAWWQIHLPTHSIRRQPITLHMIIMGVGTIPGGSRASTTGLWYDLSPSCDPPGFQPNYQIATHKYGDIGMMMDCSCSSTAYEGYQTPYIRLTWMWDSFQVGPEPQPLDCGMICCPAVTQNSQILAHQCDGNSMMTDPSANPQHMKVATYIFIMDVGAIPGGSRASTTALWYDL
jgi:hypothetical protein